MNLDQAACSGVFDRSVQDSGAIIVGAGQPPSSGVDRQRAGFSSFGSRIDLQGWGSGVVTTGYGDLFKASDRPLDPDFWYTGVFGGTSSASAIVAGAVANLQGIALDQSGIPLAPLQIRTLLVQTGSPQLGNTAEPIGPRPNLRQAVAELTHGAIDVAFDIHPERVSQPHQSEKQRADSGFHPDDRDLSCLHGQIHPRIALVQPALKLLRGMLPWRMSIETETSI